MGDPKEIWKTNAIIRSFKNQTKKLAASGSKQAEKEKAQLFAKLQKYGWGKENAGLDDILGLTLIDIMQRRLQTRVFKHGLSHSVKQARQFIIHGHIVVGGKKVTVPSYLVSLAEENTIMFAPNSELSNPEHPERVVEKKVEVSQPAQHEAKATLAKG